MGSCGGPARGQAHAFPSHARCGAGDGGRAGGRRAPLPHTAAHLLQPCPLPQDASPPACTAGVAGCAACNAGRSKCTACDTASGFLLLPSGTCLQCNILGGSYVDPASYQCKKVRGAARRCAALRRAAWRVRGGCAALRVWQWCAGAAQSLRGCKHRLLLSLCSSYREKRGSAALRSKLLMLDFCASPGMVLRMQTVAALHPRPFLPPHAVCQGQLCHLLWHQWIQLCLLQGWICAEKRGVQQGERLGLLKAPAQPGGAAVAVKQEQQQSAPAPTLYGSRGRWRRPASGAGHGCSSRPHSWQPWASTRSRSSRALQNMGAGGCAHRGSGAAGRRAGPAAANGRLAVRCGRATWACRWAGGRGAA